MESNNNYGYQDDSAAAVSPVSFGLNAKVAKLVKFEWTANGGKEGTEMEALDIVFNVNDKDFSYKQFPITKAFGENREEITDPNHPKMKAAFDNFNANMTHIMLCFVSREEYVKALSSKPITNFKDFCKVLMDLLPTNYNEINLDIFFQFQYNIKGDNTITFLELPKSVKHGKFICASIPPVGKWTEFKIDNPSSNVKNALYYKDDAGNIHPFTRTGWYMTSNFSTQQKENTPSNDMGASNPGITGESSGKW